MYRNKNYSVEKLRYKWLEHVEREKWFTSYSQQKDTEKRIIKLFGSPPYRFLEPQDPAPEHFYTRKNRLRLDEEYKYEFITPNYSALGKKPQFVERKTQTQWWRASGPLVEELLAYGIIKTGKRKPIQLSDQIQIDSGEQVMFVRLPIKAKREFFLFPEPNDKLELVSQSTQILCTAKLHSIFVPKQRSTGWAIVRNFICIPQ